MEAVSESVPQMGEVADIFGPHGGARFHLNRHDRRWAEPLCSVCRGSSANVTGQQPSAGRIGLGNISVGHQPDASARTPLAMNSAYRSAATAPITMVAGAAPAISGSSFSVARTTR